MSERGLCVTAIGTVRYLSLAQVFPRCKVNNEKLPYAA